MHTGAAVVAVVGEVAELHFKERDGGTLRRPPEKEGKWEERKGKGLLLKSWRSNAHLPTAPLKLLRPL